MKPRQGKIVYTSGSFDILNPGHIAFLRLAKKQGDYLIVGVYSNEKIQEEKENKNYPFMGIYERVLNLLALKYVDDIILNAPITINEHFIKENQIDLIVHGENHYFDIEDEHFYEEVNKNLIVEIDSEIKFNFKELAKRIEVNRDIYE